MSKDFDTDEFDGFDDDFSFDDDFDFEDGMEDEEIIDERKPVSSRVNAGVVNFRNNFDLDENPDLVRDLIKQSLPSAISTVSSGVEDIVSSTEDAIEENTSSVKDSIHTIATAAGNIGPRTGMFASLIDRIKNATASTYDTYFSPTEEEVFKEDVKSKLDQLLGDGSDDAKLEQENILREDIKTKLSYNSIQLQAETASLIGQMNAFNTSFVSSYYRRSLELKYKHIFVTKQLLKVVTGSGQINAKLLGDVVRNTSLPDLVKLKTVEAIRAAAIQSVAGGMAKKLFLTDDKDSWSERAARRIKRKVTDAADKLAEMAGPASMIDEEIGKSLSVHKMASDSLSERIKEIGTTKARKN